MGGAGISAGVQAGSFYYAADNVSVTAGTASTLTVNAITGGYDKTISGGVLNIAAGVTGEWRFLPAGIGVGVGALLVFLGDQLGVGAQISTGVVVVLAMRIFANVAAICQRSCSPLKAASPRSAKAAWPPRS